MDNRRRICFSHYLTRNLFQNPSNYRFDNMRGKARDILIQITDFSTTGSAGLKRRNNGRNQDIQYRLRLHTIQTQGVTNYFGKQIYEMKKC